jgi:hypothetical protein
MIPTNGSYEAHFRYTGHGGVSYVRKVPVEAWDDDGAALVLHEDTGGLLQARGRPGFEGVSRADRARTVAVLPGGGWRLAWKQDDGSDDVISPVLGWVVGDDGWATPLDVDEDGLFATPQDHGDVRLIRP